MGIKLLFISLLILIGAGLGVKEYNNSLLAPQQSSRFNLVLIRPEEEISLISWDPVEHSMTAWTFPAGASIRGRNSGLYEVGSLYQLGSYDGKGGMFARQKIQGFLRVPVAGFLVVGEGGENVRGNLWRGLAFSWGEKQTNLSLIDRVLLWMRMNYSFRQVEKGELVRAGVIEESGGKVQYRFDRLQEYVGSRLFDWQLGSEVIAVAVINASGKDGLGSDVADYLSNWGLDVVMVRTANNTEMQEKSSWQIGSTKDAKKLNYVFSQLLSLGEARIAPVPVEYRATVLLTVGADAEELF